MSAETKTEEEKILEACEIAWKQDKPNLAAIARKNDVNYFNFRNRYLRNDSKYTRPGANKRLTDALESSLILYIKNLDALGGSATLEKLWSAATTIANEGLDASVTEPISLSKSWVGRFLKRHPELKAVTQKPLEVARMLAQQSHKVEEYFERLQGEMMKYGIGENDLWNMDEAGFRVGMGGKRTIITFTSNNKEKHYLASELDRESLTIIEAINAAGQMIPPFIIFQAITMLSQYFRNDLEPSTVFSTSEKGFTPISSPWTGWNTSINEPKALSVGNIGCFLSMAMDLTPLDLKVFQPYKHFHRKAVNGATSLGMKSFSKADFFAALPKIRKQTMTYTTIRSAWREAGIVPWNPGKVLQKMNDEARKKQAQEADRPTTPERQARQVAAITTPTSSGGLRRMVNALDVTPRDTREFSPLLEKVMKGSLTIALSADVLRSDYQAVLDAQKEQYARKLNGARRVRNDGGTINAQTGRKIDQILVDQAADSKKKREWDRITANLYETYKNDKLTEAEVQAALPAATAQAKKR